MFETAVAEQLPRRRRDELDSQRIREHVKRVVYEKDSASGMVTIRLRS
jgi:hypothetical protein